MGLRTRYTNEQLKAADWGCPKCKADADSIDWDNEATECEECGHKFELG